jgi:uncharacterized membrane protein
MEHRVSATVGASPAAVYQLFIDIERWPELSDSTRSVRRLDTGPLRVGSEAILKQPGLPSARWRVTELDPDRAFVWETKNGGVTTIGDHRVEPDGAGSTITITLRTRGPLAPVVDLLVAGAARRHVAMELEGFRAAADAAAPPAAGPPAAPPATPPTPPAE